MAEFASKIVSSLTPKTPLDTTEFTVNSQSAVLLQFGFFSQPLPIHIQLRFDGGIQFGRAGETTVAKGALQATQAGVTIHHGHSSRTSRC
jgi:hypothetical protein